MNWCIDVYCKPLKLKTKSTVIINDTPEILSKFLNTALFLFEFCKLQKWESNGSNKYIYKFENFGALIQF